MLSTLSTTERNRRVAYDTPRLWHWWAISALIALGAVARLYRFGTLPGMNSDEVEVAMQWFRADPILWYVAPSGRAHLNPLGPIALWPLMTFAAPATWVVRLPVVLAGVAALPMTFIAVRRAFGWNHAAVATVLACGMPLLIAYSRLGWDPGYIPVFAALSLGMAYRGRWMETLGLVVLLALIHPSTMFLLPILAAPLFSDLWSRAGCSPYAARLRISAAALSAGAYATLVLALAAAFDRMPPSTDKALEVLGKIGDPQRMMQFCAGYWNILQGASVYAGFVAGGAPPQPPWPLMLLGAAVIAAAVLLWRQDRHKEFGLVIGLFLGLTAQYLAQDVAAVRITRERFAVWAAVPSCLAAAIVFNRVCESLRLAKWSVAAAIVISALWLLSFHRSYIRPLEREGGASRVAEYRTASVQAKEQVIRIVRDGRRHPQVAAQLYVGEGKMHLGLAYLALRDENLAIKNLGRTVYPQLQRSDSLDFAQAYTRAERGESDIFYVDWSTEDDELTHFAREHAVYETPPDALWNAERLPTVRTPDGQPLVSIWRLTRANRGKHARELLPRVPAR